MIDYTLYIGENCHQCDSVIEFMDNNNISYTKINVDRSSHDPPVSLFAFPALFQGDTLLRYGSDIKRYFLDKQAI